MNEILDTNFYEEGFSFSEINTGKFEFEIPILNARDAERLIQKLSDKNFHVENVRINSYN